MSDRQLVVVKANKLIEASYHLTLAEQRLLLLVISRLDSRADLEPRICHTITAQDVVAAFGLSSDRSYRLLEEATQRLYERSITIYAPDPEKPKSNRLVTRWVASALYQPQAGAVSLILAPAIVPFLSQLKNRFSQYHLRHVVQMSSIYAIRVYELLVQWRDSKTRTVELDWLRERLDLGDKYPSIRDFKRRVLDPAIEQINAHSDLWVKWDQVKRGRVVHALVFRFGPKELTTLIQEAAPQVEAPTKPPKITKAFIEQNALPGESWEEAERRLRAKHSSR